MSALSEQLRKRIESTGPIPIDEWMAACLADPEDGYYMTRDPLGRGGDFTTAPEISQMFGELIGLWCAVVWQQMGSPASFNLVEMGPGRGTLMSDLLRAASAVQGFLEASKVHMIETSPVLAERQRQTLAGVTPPVAWYAGFADVPPGPVIAIGNEFLDALPIRQIELYDDGWHERAVGLEDERFVFVPGSAVDATDLPPQAEGASIGAIIETSPAVVSVVKDVAKRIAEQGGTALLADYGYARPGVGDTLQAVRGHGYTDPLETPGEADLTAHVDFAAVAEAVEDAGARAWKVLPQGIFLEHLGIGARTAALLAKADERQALEIATARRRLVDGDAMGRLFKMLAITGKDAPAPPAFEELRL